MGIFSSARSKPAGGKTRRSSASRNVSLLKKLKKELAAVGRLDRRIAILDKKISDIPKEPFTRAKKELLTAQRLNLVGQRDELLVKVDAYKTTIQQSNQKNLTIAQSKFNGRGK